MTWNEFKQLIENQLTNEQKDYDIDYIDISATFIEHTEVYINEYKEICIH